MPKPRPTPVPQGRRDASARRAKRSRAAIRRAIAPRLRRQFRSRKVPLESAAWRLFLCEIQASPLRQMADWTAGRLECDEYSLGNHLVAHTASCSAAVKRRNAGSQKVLVLQHVYVIAARSNLS